MKWGVGKISLCQQVRKLTARKFKGIGIGQVTKWTGLIDLRLIGKWFLTIYSLTL